jgi:hypothetical protein
MAPRWAVAVPDATVKGSETGAVAVKRMMRRTEAPTTTLAAFAGARKAGPARVQNPTGLQSPCSMIAPMGDRRGRTCREAGSSIVQKIEETEADEKFRAQEWKKEGRR